MPIQAWFKCVICKKRTKGFGNNALPLKDGRCCDKCNIKVVRARLMQFKKAKGW